jgi:hypothetical protein
LSPLAAAKPSASPWRALVICASLIANCFE